MKTLKYLSAAALCAVCLSCGPRETTSIYAPLLPGADKQVIVRRINMLGLGNTLQFTDDGQVCVRLRNPEDTAIARRLLTAPGEVFIAEMYSSNESYEMLDKADIQPTRLSENMADDYPLVVLIHSPVLSTIGGLDDNPVAGYAQRGDMARVDSLLSLPQVKSVLPRDLLWVWSAKAEKNDGDDSGAATMTLLAVKKRGQITLDSRTVAKTGVRRGNTGIHEVCFDLTPPYIPIWANMTRHNIGRSLAIVADGRALCWPRVNMEIEGGRATITGDYSLGEARELAAIIGSGPLFPR